MLPIKAPKIIGDVCEMVVIKKFPPKATVEIIIRAQFFSPGVIDSDLNSDKML